MNERGPSRQPAGSNSGPTVPNPGVTRPAGTYRHKTESRLRAFLANPLGLATISIVAFVVLAFPFLDKAFDWKRTTDAIPIIMYVLLALGLNVVVGFAGLLDLGYAAFFAIGAYTAAMLTSSESPLNNGTLNWYSNFWLAIPVAFFVAIAAGMILGAPTLRLRGDYLAIVTLGFGEIVPRVFRLASGITKGEAGLGGIAKPEINIGWLNFHYVVGTDPFLGLQDYSFIGLKDFTLNPLVSWYYLLLVLGVVALIGLRRLQDSRLGRAWMAIREDEIAASAMGINLVSTKLSAFAMGASLSGLVGAVYGSYIGLVYPSAFEFSTSIILLCAVILGGLGNIWGVIVGGIIIQGFDRIFAGELTKWLNGLGNSTHIDFLSSIQLSNFRFFIFGAALVILMLVRPEGIFPSQRRRAELHPEEVILDGHAPHGVEPSTESLQEQQSLYDMRTKDVSEQENR
jgi:branched-chain amino acid transport system permease protein